MDNLTHSVVGLTIGELVQRSVAAEATEAAQRTRRRLLLTAGWAASNFPDLDLVLTGLLPAPLGYLLHHRGHTHTLLYLLPQALLLLAVLWLLWPGARHLLRSSRPARRALAATIGIGMLFHIVMDSLNSYGVHPFYPVDGRWIYGDLVFILEPVFWVALGAPLAMSAPSKLARVLLLGTLGAIVVWSTFAGYLHWASSTGLLVLGGVLALWQANSGALKRTALAAGVLAGAAYIGIQGLASSSGKQQVAARAGPGSEVLDVVMTGYPANPFCWNFISVERIAAQDSYRLRRGMLSVAPGLVPLAACPASFSDAPPGAAGTEGLRVLWQQDSSLAELRRRAASCHFQAWLRFARVPALSPTEVSDARFSMRSGTNFSTLSFSAFEGRPCPANVPAWDMPRADLLRDR